MLREKRCFSFNLIKKLFYNILRFKGDIDEK